MRPPLLRPSSRSCRPTPATTPGWPPPSGPILRRATSLEVATRSWPSAASTALTLDPSLATFKNLVAEGKVHYFIAGGGFGGGAGAAGARFGTGGRRPVPGAATGGGRVADFPPLSRQAGPGGFRKSEDSSAITTWVEAHFTATTVGGVTLYNLTQPKG